jgi:glycosyltransferase involved in cell wall biosynthesis
MSLGLAVISTKVGGMPMLIENNSDGVLVPVNDAQAMASEIDKLIKHSEKVQLLTENARKKVEAFAWEKVKTDWNRVLNS